MSATAMEPAKTAEAAPVNESPIGKSAFTDSVSVTSVVLRNSPGPTRIVCSKAAPARVTTRPAVVSLSSPLP